MRGVHHIAKTEDKGHGPMYPGQGLCIRALRVVAIHLAIGPLTRRSAPVVAGVWPCCATCVFYFNVCVSGGGGGGGVGVGDYASKSI